MADVLALVHAVPLTPALSEILTKIAALPSASRIVVFGSASKSDISPNDLDICLLAEDCADWEHALRDHKATIASLRKFSYEYYGYLDPFVLTKDGLAVRNDTATGWQVAKKARALTKSIRENGRPLNEVLLERTAAGKSLADEPVVAGTARHRPR